jgi:hypothetical protein
MTEDTLERWRAEEQAVRAQLATPGRIRPEQVRGRSGLETLQAIFAGELPSPLIGATLRPRSGRTKATFWFQVISGQN